MTTLRPCLAAALALLLVASGTRAEMPSDGEEGFFFVHVSDVHAYQHSTQVIEHYGLGPSWIPTLVLAVFALRDYEERLIPRYSRDIIGPIRRALGIAPGDESFFEVSDGARYFEEIRRPGSDIGNAEAALRASFREIGALAPDFIVNTGDIVFDSGKVPAEIAESWARLYQSASSAAGVPVHHTIGNHELGGIYREDADPQSPRYGSGFFESHFGERLYAFDRGAFRFVALDTHRPREDGEGWHYNQMRPEAARWLDTTLSSAGGRSVVLMNHEPFYEDPEWGADESIDDNVVQDEGLLAKHDVAYTLTGHIHLPGVGRSGATTHISTGALSGMHWVLPPDAAPRGYRLLYAKGRKLYSAWKRSGEAVLGFVCPPQDPDLWALCGEADAETMAREVVAVAADAAGPLRDLRLEVAGQPLPHEAWGRFFIRATLPDDVPRAAITLRATRATGEALAVPLAPPGAQSTRVQSTPAQSTGK